MQINTKHRDYTKTAPQWDRARDAFAGGDQVRSKSTQYLKRLKGQSQEDYDNYLQRADWFGATKRTVNALTGAVFRKDPATEGTDPFKRHLDDITLNGQGFTSFARRSFREVILAGRFGVLIDMTTKEQQEAGEPARPYWTGYSAENIINWRSVRIAGRELLTMVVLKETDEEINDKDPFKVEARERWRVLKLERKGGKFIYSNELWKGKGNKDAASPTEFERVSEVIPLNKGEPLGFIPFRFFGPESTSTRAEPPPLLDMIDMNFSHFRTSADLEHAAHFTALPTPWAAGFRAEKGELTIGSSTAWVSKEPDAKVGMLEYTGKGLEALEKRLEKKELQMAVLGARLLEPRKDTVERAETLRIKQAGEVSVLQSIAMTQSAGLTDLMRWHAQWAGITNTDKIIVQLNTDFFETKMDPKMMQSLMLASQGGLISEETFYFNLERGEITIPGRGWEEEKQLIDAQDVGLESGRG